MEGLRIWWKQQLTNIMARNDDRKVEKLLGIKLSLISPPLPSSSLPTEVEVEAITSSGIRPRTAFERVEGLELQIPDFVFTLSREDENGNCMISHPFITGARGLVSSGRKPDYFVLKRKGLDTLAERNSWKQTFIHGLLLESKRCGPMRRGLEKLRVVGILPSRCVRNRVGGCGKFSASAREVVLTC